MSDRATITVQETLPVDQHLNRDHGVRVSQLPQTDVEVVALHERKHQGGSYRHEHPQET